MQFNVEFSPAYSLAIAKLEQGDSVMAESGAMVTQDAHIRMETSATKGKGVGGFLKGLGRSLFLGESFFRNTFHADNGPGEVTFAPSLPGDIMMYEMAGSDLIIQQQSYLASGTGVEIETKWGGFKSFFGEGKMFWIRAFGNGPLALNAFGAIKQIDVDGHFIIDTGHIVAFEPTLSFDIKRVGSWFSTFFSSEGLVCRFNGKGKLYIQSRNPAEFGSLVGAKLPPRNK
ncbi:MAG: TIGR00266 family protein [Deltaproteobacteria bacterium]|nr:TIGR00266 family protein [Deltaproteobacteria bacterium]MBN2672717.1 TIGR00266 family protein [Deltaproteobacteria bacterium]